MRKFSLGYLAGTAATVISLVVAVPVGAQAVTGPVAHRPAAQAARPPVLADFEGQTIDLSQGWGAAQACLVWRQGGVVECFGTSAQLDARETQLAPQHQAVAASGVTTGGARPAATSSSSCTSSLDLYDYTSYGGRRLSYWDRGFWQNLTDAGFNDQVSSYFTGACYAHLAQDIWGGGYWYPGNTGPYHPEPYMSGGWDNQVSSIYLA